MHGLFLSLEKVCCNLARNTESSSDSLSAVAKSVADWCDIVQNLKQERMKAATACAL